MSESDEEENYCFYGKPLEPYDEDAFPKKKPISAEDQIATDAQGRRRFHGAFTGGFSAGFYNTVGSLEGWTPSEFRSSRQEKAQSQKQKPQDFMDDEDIGEFGFAPEVVRATKEFSTASKRKRDMSSVFSGPIPGEPVLHTLIGSGDENIGYLLLKNIGLQDKKNLKEQIASTEKTYGCEMPSGYDLTSFSSVLEEDNYRIPDIYRQYIQKPQNNSFGIGYVGLDKSHMNLFKSSNFVMHDKNKKLSIDGQAFGVGAFEEEDDDIYAKEDMSNYDYEITKEKRTTSKREHIENKIFDMFILAKLPTQSIISFPLPNIPHSFSGKHKLKKSRFEPIPDEITKLVPRSIINPNVRAKYLGEEVNKEHTSSRETKDSVSSDKFTRDRSEHEQEENIETRSSKNAEKHKTVFNADLIFDKFVTASQSDDHTNILQDVKPSITNHGTQEMRDAARMKMFGPLTRINLDWKPCALLCKRFNVPEPNFENTLSSKKKRTKHLIFQYQQHNESEIEYKPGLSIPMEAAKLDSKENQTCQEILENDGTSNKMMSHSLDINSPNNQVIEEKENIDSELVTPDNNIVEKPKELTDKLDIEKNIDLFKAVFLSSSESEDESRDETPQTSIMEEMKTNILSDKFLPKIRSVKEGILSNIDQIQFIKPAKRLPEDNKIETSPEHEKKDSVNNVLSYGPRAPEKFCSALKINTDFVENSSSGDEWVEKDSDHKKKKKKHKKKHKREKKSHKKDKKDKG